jgi:hypothetical protein
MAFIVNMSAFPQQESAGVESESQLVLFADFADRIYQVPPDLSSLCGG